MLQKARYRRPELEPVKCAACPRLTDEPRRGKCLGCYLRERRGTALPPDAACQCGEANPIVLVRVATGVSCYNCRALDAAGVARVA